MNQVDDLRCPPIIRNQLCFHIPSDYYVNCILFPDHDFSTAQYKFAQLGE